MAATAKQKRALKRQVRKNGRIALANSVGHNKPVPTPPDFGPVKFTAAQQAANPDEPMTRVIKDIGSIGVWKAGFSATGQAVSENFDDAKLQQIYRNAKAYMASGHAINLGKNHGDEDLTIATDDLIKPLDDLRYENGVLWGSFYVTPAEAKYLNNPAIKTSPGLVRNYQAGDMTVYPGLSMVHLAATDRPVMGGQGRFLVMKNWVAPPATKRAIPKNIGLANTIQKFRAKIKGRNVMPRAIALANSLSKGTGSMDLQALIAAINALLQAFGLGQLGDDTNEQNIVGRLEGLAMAVGGQVPPDEPDPSNADPGAVGTDTGNADATGAGVAMNNRLFGGISKLVDQRFAALKSEFKPLIDGVNTLLSSEVAKKTAEKKDAYMTFRNRLGEAGVEEAILAAKDKLAEKLDWSPEVLEGLSPTVRMNNATKAGAKPTPAEGQGGEDGPLSDDAMAARLKARGIDPALMPKS